jgi:transmembrane sensor
MTPKDILKAQRSIYLIDGSIKGGLTDEELLELEAWKQSDRDNQLLLAEASSADFRKIALQWQVEASERSLARVEKRIAHKKRYILVRIAAAAVLIIGISTFLMNNSMFFGSSVSKNDIPPGRNGAILTYQNGITIQLSEKKTGVVIAENQLKYDDGTIVAQHLDRKALPLQMTASTPAGFTYSLTLPDGSRVWLNAKSSLSFPSSFKAEERREVNLTGEAYFKINHDESRPFIVNTSEQTVEDIGTEFSINAYADDPAIKTTLFEGAARVTKTKGQSFILKPGEQSVVTPTSIQVVQADLEEALAWKNGYFRFNNENIRSIMRKISRWYSVEVEFEGPISDEGLYGTISRHKNISEVLEMLQQTKNVHFEIKERRITVKK